MFTGSKVVNKEASAAFSMTKRVNVGAFDEDLARTPGPCHYSVTQPDSYKNKGPAYSLQSRTYLAGQYSYVNKYFSKQIQSTPLNRVAV